MVQWLRPCLPMQGVWVRFLVRELRHHMLTGQKKTKHKKKKEKNLKEIKKVQQNKMTVLDWVLPFWTLAPYSSKSSSPDGLFGVRRQSGALAQGTLRLYTCRPRDKKGESLPRAAIEGDTDS